MKAMARVRPAHFFRAVDTLARDLPSEERKAMYKDGKKRLEFAIRETSGLIKEAEEASEAGRRDPDYRASEVSDLWDDVFKHLETLSRAPKQFSWQTGTWNGGPCAPRAQGWQLATMCLREETPDPKRVAVACGAGEHAFLPEGATTAARVQREVTQRILKAAVPKRTLTVYRGSGSKEPGGELSGEVFERDGKMLLPVRPLSSWSLSRKWAEAHGTCVVKKEIPIDRIAAVSFAAGGMSGPELEVVVESDGFYEEIPPGGLICRR